MQKPTLLTALILSVIFCHSQTKIGIFAGPQLSTARYVIEGDKQSTSDKAGFQLGMMVKVPFDNQLFFTPAIFYSMKGYKVNFNRPSFPPDTTALNNDTRIHTLEVAVMLQYDFSKKADHFFLKSGLSLDGQLAGKESYSLKNGSTVSRSMPFSFGEYGYAGANLLVQFGYEARNDLALFAQYSYGIGTIDNADGGPEIKHRVIGISIAKYLRSKKSRTASTK
jgi:hypothetical protein